MTPEPNNNKITVMLVDDSAVVRGGLSRILEADASIEVVASKSNGLQAVESVEKYSPDIILLDIEMPVMDGLTALPKLLDKSPSSKVIVVSTMTEKGAAITMKALSLGAVDCFVKPQGGTGQLGSEFQRDLIARIKALAPQSKRREALKSEPKNTQPQNIASAERVAVPPPSADGSITLSQKHSYGGKPKILAIGCSTGGPQALAKVVPYLKGLDIPIIITQHMPATFTKILAQHLAQQTGISVQEGAEGMKVEAGQIYLAPGNYHMLLKEKDGDVVIHLDDGPQVNFCKPAVDPMLSSAIQVYGQKILCAILTGMGQDGLGGAKELVDTGGRVIAQDQETSIVWGMPGAVARAGLCHKVLPLDEIGPWLKNACH